MKVKIPFLKRFREPMLNGTKIMTSRTKIYGVKGDTFEAFDATFEIDDERLMQLWEICNHYQDEGCSSMEEFVALWKKLHPRKVAKPYDWFYAHFFHKVNSIGRK